MELKLQEEFLDIAQKTLLIVPYGIETEVYAIVIRAISGF